MPQRVDDKVKRRGGLTPARIVEVVSREWQAPIRQHPLETALADVRLRHAFGDVSEAQTGQRGVQQLRRAVTG